MMRMRFLVGLVAWVGLTGCIRNQAMRTSSPERPLERLDRTAFVGLVVTKHYAILDAAGDVVDAMPVQFTPADSSTGSPFARCAARAAQVRTSEVSIWGTRSTRPARTLREAYAACRLRGDLAAVAPVNHGFGIARSMEFQEALLDSLVMLAHEISKQSLLKALFQRTALGTVLSPEATRLALERAGLAGLRGNLLRAVERDARSDGDAVSVACDILDVDALLFVALDSDDEATVGVDALGSATDSVHEAATVAVDLLVLRPRNDSQWLRLRFEHRAPTPLEAWSSVGDAVIGLLEPEGGARPEPPHPWAR